MNERFTIMKDAISPSRSQHQLAMIDAVNDGRIILDPVTDDRNPFAGVVHTDNESCHVAFLAISEGVEDARCLLLIESTLGLNMARHKLGEPSLARERQEAGP